MKLTTAINRVGLSDRIILKIFLLFHDFINDSHFTLIYITSLSLTFSEIYIE